MAAASALLERGCDVLMLDAGLSLEPDRRAVVDQLARVSHEKWPGDQLGRIRNEGQIDEDGLPVKLLYGSDFPFRRAGELVTTQQAGVSFKSSLAQGGLSNLWGAAVLPYNARDIDDWQVGADALAGHYESVTKFFSLSARDDDLTGLFPLYTGDACPLRLSRQAQALHDDLSRSSAALREAGVTFGQSRIAVTAQAQGDRPGCVYCGSCLHGCPYELIYCSEHTLRKLCSNDRFEYRPNVLVTGLSDRDGQVEITARAVDSESTGTMTFSADRVFVACGLIASTKLILRTLQAFDQPVSIRDSQYFLLPFMRYRGISGVATEPLHTLSQLFVELDDPTISRRLVHLQVYSYSDMLAHALRAKFGPLHSLLGLPIRSALARMSLIQCFVHSDDSPSPNATLVRDDDDPGGARLVIEVTAQELQKRQIVKAIVRKLRGLRRAFRSVFVTPMMQMTEPGRSFHSGGTLPMRASPNALESDLLGRPGGLRRVHVVDASVLPSIAATTVTLTVMANAHRIASEAVETKP